MRNERENAILTAIEEARKNVSTFILKLIINCFQYYQFLLLDYRSAWISYSTVGTVKDLKLILEN